MKQSQLHSLVAVIFAIIGVLFIIEGLPSLLYLPILFVGFGLEDVDLSMLMAVLMPLWLILVGLVLILQRSNFADRLVYTHESSGVDQELNTLEQGESGDFEALDGNDPATVPQAADESADNDGIEILDPEESNAADLEEDRVFEINKNERELWLQQVPKTLIAVCGFVLIAYGLIPILSTLAEMLLLRDASTKSALFSTSNIRLWSLLEGLSSLGVGMLLATQHHRIIVAWHTLWGKTPQYPD